MLRPEKIIFVNCKRVNSTVNGNNFFHFNKTDRSRVSVTACIYFGSVIRFSDKIVNITNYGKMKYVRGI